MRKRAAAEHAGQPSEAPTGDEDSGTSNAG
jgi:hypothetical protein